MLASRFFPTIRQVTVQSITKRFLSQRLKGTVKWFDSKKGFGFITTADAKEYFVHQSAIKADGFRSLADAEEVEFDAVADDAKGRVKAVNVTGPNGSAVRGAEKKPRRQPHEGRQRGDSY